MKLRVVAFDLSLTATGVASPDMVALLKPPKLDGLERLQWIRDQVLNLTVSADVVVVEGYSFGSGNKAHALGELGGVVRLALFEEGRRFVVVPPSSRAKYATGKGNAGKEQVFAEAIRRLGYQGHDNNEADAMWLRAMACDHYGAPIAKMPSSHREVLKKITWPPIGKRSK